MNYLVFAEKFKGCEDLDGKAADQVQAKSIVIITDDKLVQIFTH